MVFRYALTSSPTLDGNDLTHMGIDEMRPPEVDYVVSQDKAGNPNRPLSPQGQSFLEISAPNVALVTWKQAEDGKGTILRLQETSGQATEAMVGLPLKTIRSAQLCSGVEDNLGPLAVDGNHVRVPLKPFEVVTIRMGGS